MTIGAYMPIGSGDRKDHPRGVPYRSWKDMGDDMAARVAKHGYRSAVVWIPHGLDADGGMRFSSPFGIDEPECKWMRSQRDFVACWKNVRNAGLQTMWWYTGNTFHGKVPANALGRADLRKLAVNIGALAAEAGFTGVVIDASANALVGSTEWLLAQYILELFNMNVGYEGWADDMHPHWKADVRLHGFSKPAWWKLDQNSNGTMYGARPLGGRSVLHLEGATKAERVALAQRILKTGCSVYDDVWNGIAPADMEEK